MGINPTSAGYDSFEVTPNLGSLDWFEGTVPINNGEVNIYLDKNELKVTSTKDGGIIKYKEHNIPLKKNVEVIIKL